MKLSDIFSDAEWTNPVLLGFVYHVDIKLISYSDFTCATDDIQKSRKNAIFENCINNMSFEKCLMLFKMARPVRSRLHFNLIKHFTQQTFIFKNVVFCIFNQKNEEVHENFSKTRLNCCPCKCTNLGKKSFQYHQRILRKMRLKTFANNFD